MAVVKAVVFLVYSLASYSFVSSMEEPIITRDIYDLLHYPNCDGKKADKFDCGDTNAGRFGDLAVCQCRCKNGYLAYRDPAVQFDGQMYDFKNGSRECVWFGLYREGCHYLHVDETLMLDKNSFPVPTILDLTASGSVNLKKQDEFKHGQTLCVDAYVHIPGKNIWEKVNGINFELKPLDTEKKTRYKLSWSMSSNADIYAYQGLVMKLNFRECFQSMVFCMIAKVAGTYAGNDNCKQRATNGRCCIFPFVHNGTVHYNCISSSDMTGGKWCAVSLNKSIDDGNHKWREFCPAATRPLSRPPPTFHPEPTRPNKKTTPKQLKTDHQRFKTTRQGKDRVGSHPIEPITVTVTHHTCRGSSKVLPTFGAREDSGGSGNAGSIVGIVLGILVLLAVVALFGYYLRRRKSTTRGKSRPRKTVSKDNLAESHYASIYSAGTPSNTLNRLNMGYQQSIELTEDQAAAVVRRSYLRGSLKNGGTHFYDTVENRGRPDTGLSCPIYSMPEADYSLIMEQRQTKIDNAFLPVLPVMLSGTRNCTNHLYSVLERDNDPLRHPEPTDNDTVFVEANPLYGTTTQYKMHKGKAGNEGGFAEANPLYGTTTGFNRNAPPPLPPRLYEDSKGKLPSKTQPAKPGERDI